MSGGRGWKLLVPKFIAVDMTAESRAVRSGNAGRTAEHRAGPRSAELVERWTYPSPPCPSLPSRPRPRCALIGRSGGRNQEIFSPPLWYQKLTFGTKEQTRLGRCSPLPEDTSLCPGVFIPSSCLPGTEFPICAEGLIKARNTLKEGVASFLWVWRHNAINGLYSQKLRQGIVLHTCSPNWGG